jgi:hypothetical protein
MILMEKFRVTLCLKQRNTRAVCKVRGYTLLLRVETLWRCGDGLGLFFEVPPLASDAFLTELHPLLENVLQAVDLFEISCLGAPFSWLEKPRNRMGRDLDCMADVLMGFHRSNFSKVNTKIQFRSRPMRFLGFSKVHRLRREVLRKRDRHRTSTNFRLGIIRWVYELCKRPSYIVRFNTRPADLHLAPN